MEGKGRMGEIKGDRENEIDGKREEEREREREGVPGSVGMVKWEEKGRERE